MFSEMMPPISAMMDRMTVKRKSRTRQGDSEAPPTHPMRPEKNRVKPSAMTTQVKIWKRKQVGMNPPLPSDFNERSYLCYLKQLIEKYSKGWDSNGESLFSEGAFQSVSCCISGKQKLLHIQVEDQTSPLRKTHQCVHCNCLQISAAQIWSS